MNYTPNTQSVIPLPTTINGYKKFPSKIYQIYDISTKNPNGIIPVKTIARHFYDGCSIDTAKRRLREDFHTLHREMLFPKILLMTPQGVIWATKEEATTYADKLRKEALDRLQTESILRKKIEMDGQCRLPDGTHTREVYNSLAEVK